MNGIFQQGDRLVFPGPGNGMPDGSQDKKCTVPENRMPVIAPHDPYRFTVQDSRVFAHNQKNHFLNPERQHTE